MTDFLATCDCCKRVLVEGETAWAYDWKVFATEGPQATMRAEVRYVCDACEAQR